MLTVCFMGNVPSEAHKEDGNNLKCVPADVSLKNAAKIYAQKNIRVIV